MGVAIIHIQYTCHYLDSGNEGGVYISIQPVDQLSTMLAGKLQATHCDNPMGTFFSSQKRIERKLISN